MLENCYTSFVNLDSRPDRLNHMTKELGRIGIQAIRQRGIPWRECDLNSPKHQVMLNRTPGALGCHLSQVEIIKKAFEAGSNAFVMEDDLVFASDFMERMDYVSKWIAGKEWDIFWLGATFHSPAYWHKKGQSNMRPNCSAQLGKDFDHTDDPRIKRTYGAFCTYAYIVNYNSIEKILGLLDKHLHESIGIDWLFIKLQPQLKTFAFVPGSVRQINNLSDIGTNPDGSPAMTVFSGFSKLNGTEENSRYWFQDKIENFNPDTFQWK
jgi:GR25 family glycosyltransferase involved in LPS biosynthesis